MVGLGGGFIIVPVLRLFFHLNPGAAAGTSLALVVANSGSGAFTYWLQKRVNVRIGLLAAAGGIPASIAGAYVSTIVSPRLFDWLFAGFLIAVATDMIVNRKRRRQAQRDPGHAGGGGHWARWVFIGLGVGFLSSLFGIGGGVVLIPSLLYFSDLPAHAISATSHFGIILTSPVGLVAHIVQRDITWSYVLPLVIGGLLGGPLGARLSLRLRSQALMVVVGVALLIAAGALVARHLGA